MPRGIYQRTKKRGGWIAWNKGMKMSNDFREKARKRQLGVPSTRKGIKGLYHSGSFKKGHKAYPNTEKTRFKKGTMSLENHPNWKGGTKGIWKVKRLEKIAGREKPKQCEVCKRFGKICFDHNHETGKFRGWICHKCNLALGLVNDNLEILESLIKYLQNES